MEINGVEGYEEELPEGEEFEAEAPQAAEDADPVPEAVPDDPVPAAPGTVLGAFSSVKTVSGAGFGEEKAGEKQTEEEQGGSPEASETGGTGAVPAEPEELVEDSQTGEAAGSVFPAEVWQEYLELREVQHMELVSYAESIRNISLCILVGVGVAVGCLLIRELSSYFK